MFFTFVLRYLDKAPFKILDEIFCVFKLFDKVLFKILDKVLFMLLMLVS